MVISGSRRLRQAGLCGKGRKRIEKIRLSDLLRRLVVDGLGWPSRMHDEHDGSPAAATGIAAIAFAEADYGFVIGIDGLAGMLLQFKHRVASAVRRFPWEEKSKQLHQAHDAAPLPTAQLS